MKVERKFFKCEICGNMVGLIQNGGGELVCCGQPMKLLEPNTVDAANEKHVPFVKREGNKLHVQVGEVEHPMLDEHYIQWIMVAQDDRTQRAYLKPGSKPVADFDVHDGAVTVYEYCNLHGLWSADA